MKIQANCNIMQQILKVIYQTVKEEQPDLLVVDSIQTIYHPESALRQVLFHKFVKVHKV